MRPRSAAHGGRAAGIPPQDEDYVVKSIIIDDTEPVLTADSPRWQRRANAIANTDWFQWLVVGRCPM